MQKSQPRRRLFKGMIGDKIQVNMPIVENQNAAELLFELENAGF